MSRIAVLESLGRAITPAMVQGSMAFFARQVIQPSADLCVVDRDLSYGALERQRLDLFRPVRIGPTRHSVLQQYRRVGGAARVYRRDHDVPIGAWGELARGQ
jgi:hypothetical protein